MTAFLWRAALMAALLVTGSVWLRPQKPQDIDPGTRFEEIAESAGCQNLHTTVVLSPRFENIMPWLASVGAAVAAADFDGDGWTDLYVTNCGRHSPNRLFRNQGDGTFRDVATASGVACGNPEGASMHAVFGDIDNDSDLDLYVVKWGEENQLFLNLGDGTFRDGTTAAGVGSWGYGNAATFLDYDRDGWLDLLVGNYFADRVVDPQTGALVRSDLWDPVTTRVMHSTFTHAENGGRTLLYRNRGDGTFADVAEELGLRVTGWTLAVGAADLNNDGWPDLYLANDFGADELYLNTGAVEDPPRFQRVVDTSGHPGIGSDWWKGMNVDFGDVDNNGFLDIYVTNILSRRYKTDEGNMLWLNLPGGTAPGGRRFQNAGESSGSHDGGWGWGAKFLDVQNDGLLDVFAVNGFVSGDQSHTYWYALQEMVTQTRNQAADAQDWPVMGDRDLSGYEPSRLFVQYKTGPHDKGPRFAELASRAGIVDLYNGRGVAVLDLESDGALDLYVANQGQPSTLYRNQLHEVGPERPWLGLVLVGRPEWPHRIGSRSFATTQGAVGTRVRLVTQERTQTRELSGGTGFASQSESRIHFGLPGAPERLVVDWPSGRQQTFEASELGPWIGGYARLVEGQELEPVPVTQKRSGS